MNPAKSIVVVLLATFATYILFNLFAERLFKFFFKVTSSHLGIVVCIVVILLPTILILITSFIEKYTMIKIAYFL